MSEAVAQYAAAEYADLNRLDGYDRSLLVGYVQRYRNREHVIEGVGVDWIVLRPLADVTIPVFVHPVTSHHLLRWYPLVPGVFDDGVWVLSCMVPTEGYVALCAQHPFFLRHKIAPCPPTWVAIAELESGRDAREVADKAQRDEAAFIARMSVVETVS